MIEVKLAEENAMLRERVANLSDSIDGKNATLNSIRQYADGLIKREKAALDRVAELEHSVADAIEQIEAIQGTSQVHIDRVAELESERVSVLDRAEKVATVRVESPIDALDIVEQAMAQTMRERGEAFARVAELEGEVEDWKAGSELEAREADRGRKRVAELEGHLDIEKELTHEMESERDVSLARVTALEDERLAVLAPKPDHVGAKLLVAETVRLVDSLDGLGEAIKIKRGVDGLSLRGLAEATGISFNTICRTERGVCDPRLSSVLPLLRWLFADQGGKEES